MIDDENEATFMEAELDALYEQLKWGIATVLFSLLLVGVFA